MLDASLSQQRLAHTRSCSNLAGSRTIPISESYWVHTSLCNWFVKS